MIHFRWGIESSMEFLGILELLLKSRNGKTGASGSGTVMRAPLPGGSPIESVRGGGSSIMHDGSPESETDAELAVALAKAAPLLAADIIEILRENVSDLADVKTAMEAAPGKAVKDVVQGVLGKALGSAMRQPDRRRDDPYLKDRREPAKAKKDYHQPLTRGEVPLIELKRRGKAAALAALPAPEEEKS